MTKTECAVYDLLKEIGVPTHKKGYAYIQEAVTNKYDGKYEDFSITGPKGIYCDVAKKFRTEASRVERDIRSAIDYAFNYGDPKVLYGIFGNSIAPGRESQQTPCLSSSAQRNLSGESRHKKVPADSGTNAKTR